MKNRYIDLIEQTFDFPQEDFELKGSLLQFNGIDVMKLIEEYGTPLHFTYLPKISKNIKKVKLLFEEAMLSVDYKGKYYYCYCTKSSHFKHIFKEALKNDIHIETSSAFDIDIIRKLYADKLIDKKKYIVCNGFKRDQYIDNVVSLINDGFENTIPILDNAEEINLLTNKVNKSFKVGIRIASEEEPKFEFYTSRLGIGYKDIVPYYKDVIKKKKGVELKMLHFFINTGIKDNAYYWNELHKCLKVYVNLKKECSTLDSLNIGGGFPIKNSLGFDYDYKYMINEIVNQVKTVCKAAKVDEPDLFTEFGTYTVGESGGMVYKVLAQKQQNDREKWNMIDSSFITTLPDSWAINKRFVMLPVNKWNENYERVLLGGLTCDSDDYYNSEQHINAIYLPKYTEDKPLYIGFFNTGAYQESIGGYGGLQHCLIPQPRHILVDKDENDNVVTRIFKDSTESQQFLEILGY